ncbi:MAG: anti-sigma factor domain-containing protein [Rubrobacteraceae bacterium]
MGVLSDEERESFEAYLELHPELRPEIEQMSAVAQLLAVAPDEHDPPPEFRQNILRRIEGQTAQSPAPTAGRRSLWAAFREYFSIQRFALGAVSVLAVALFAWNLLLQDDLRSLEREVQGLQSGPGQHKVHAMQGSGKADNASAHVVDLAGHDPVFVGRNLPEISEDETMQVWVIVDGEPKPAGTFVPDGNVTSAHLTRSLKDGEAVEITVEPSGGSQQPTDDHILRTKVHT